MGKGSGHDIYRVDLAAVLAKYQGEAVDKLLPVFAMAKQRQWLLYFDGTDGLFSKPPTPGDTHAATQLTSLLQYLNTYPGAVIMSTTLTGAIANSALPVFDFEVNFPVPDAELRLQLWQKAFAGKINPDVNLPDLAAAYEVTGGNIVNILRYCSLKAAKDGTELISLAAIKEGLQKELYKG